MKKVVFAALVTAAVVSACGGSPESARVALVANVAPIANAGPDQSVIAGSTAVILDGSRSTDTNGDPIQFAWTLADKPRDSTAALSDSTSAKPTFTADLPGMYVATLVVTDGVLSSSAASVTVSAATANAAPVANAGSAQNVLTGTTVTLDGSASSDANGDPLTYSWTLSSKPASSSATLTGVILAKPTFTADVAGIYVATLTVNDGQVGSPPSTVTVTAAGANAAPIAQAGSAQSVIVGSSVTLNGIGSSDANGDALMYSWTLSIRPNGSAASLNGATTSSPTFTADAAGTYVATLIVNDGKVDSAPATVAVTAQTVVGFDAISPLPPNMVSYGFEAASLTSLGDRIALKPGSPRTLHSITVAMSSWACETGAWNLGTCASGPNAAFTHPITITIYDSSGNVLTTRTQTFSIPYRPSADPTCTGGRWKAMNGTCYNGLASTITFDLRSLNVKLPDDVFAFDVSYNTRTHGPMPIGITGPYDSLNVGLYDSAATTPSVGSDIEPGVLRVNGASQTEGYGIMSQAVVAAP